MATLPLPSQTSLPLSKPGAGAEAPPSDSPIHAPLPGLSKPADSPHNFGRPVTPSPVVIRNVDPLGTTDWDETVRSFPGHSVFHTQAWARVLLEAYGYKPAYLVAQNGPAISALLPLAEVDSWLTGRRGVCLPFTDYCPALSRSPEEAVQLSAHALNMGQARRWKYLEFRGAQPAEQEPVPSIVYLGHRLDLTQDETRLFNGMDSATRRSLRKAEKSGLKVEFSNSLQAVRTYYTLHCKTRQRHGLPPQPWSFFRAIQEHLLEKDLGTVALATFRERPIAGAVYFQFGSQALYKFGASDIKWQHLRGNNLVMWEAIKRFAQQQLTTLDLGRTAQDNLGLARFKRGLGAREFIIPYHRFDYRESAYVTRQEMETGWHCRVFRALPLGVARIVGFLFYKHLG